MEEKLKDTAEHATNTKSGLYKQRSEKQKLNWFSIAYLSLKKTWLTQKIIHGNSLVGMTVIGIRGWETKRCSCEQPELKVWLII